MSSTTPEKPQQQFAQQNWSDTKIRLFNVVIIFLNATTIFDIVKNKLPSTDSETKKRLEYASVVVMSLGILLSILFIVYPVYWRHVYLFGALVLTIILQFILFIVKSSIH